MKNLGIALAILLGSALVVSGIAVAVELTSEGQGSTTAQTYEAEPTYEPWDLDQIISETCYNGNFQNGYSGLLYAQGGEATCSDPRYTSGYLYYGVYNLYADVEAEIAQNTSLSMGIVSLTDEGTYFLIAGSQLKESEVSSLIKTYGFTVVNGNL